METPKSLPEHPVIQVVEVAIHWAVDVADYELQISRNAVEWTSVMHASGLAGQTVWSSFLATADAQWIRVVPGTGRELELDDVSQFVG